MVIEQKYKLLKKRFGEKYTNRLIRAYEGKETITSIAKDYNKSRQAVSAVIIRYLGYKKRANSLTREERINRFIDQKLKVYPSLWEQLLLLKDVLLSIEEGKLKKVKQGTAFVVKDKEFRFKFRSSLKNFNWLSLWVTKPELADYYIITTFKGIAIKFLSFRNTSMNAKEFSMNKERIIRLLYEVK